MSRLRVAIAVAAGCLLTWTTPVLADCVSCGPGGECYSVSAGFSGNCECRIRNISGAVVCTPSGVCDPNDAGTCKNDPFPQVIAARGGISTPFLNDLAEKDALLAGAVWGGLSGDNASHKAERSGRTSKDVTGTMRNEGRNYTFRAQLLPIAQDGVALTIHVEEDGTGHSQDYTGVILGGGRSGHLVRVGTRSKTPVFSWNLPQ